MRNLYRGKKLWDIAYWVEKRLTFCEKAFSVLVF